MLEAAPLAATLREAAEAYYNAQGWVCHPLGPDANGFPKRPITPDWPNIPAYWPRIDALPWEQATGLGIILGPTSSNLAVLDVDSNSLAKAIYAILNTPTSTGTKQATYVVRTVRKRMHLYVREQHPSPSSKFAVRWQGEDVTIERKGAGTQVAAPPTAGYLLVTDALWEWENLDALWILLDARLQYLRPQDYAPPLPEARPQRAWATTVPEGQRNDTLYIEAHKLREAGMSLDQAIATLEARADVAYQDGYRIAAQELRATVRSAYRKGEVITDVLAKFTHRGPDVLGRGRRLFP